MGAFKSGRDKIAKLAETKIAKAIDFLSQPRDLTTVRRVSHYLPRMREAYQDIQIGKSILESQKSDFLWRPGTPDLSILEWKRGVALERLAQQAYRARVSPTEQEENPREPELADVDALPQITDLEIWKDLGFDVPGDLDALKNKVRAYLRYRVPMDPAYFIRCAELDLVGLKIPGFFPTPYNLAAELISHVVAGYEARVLEPGAGSGTFAQAIKDAGYENLYCCERNYRLYGLLQKKGFNMIGRDVYDLPPHEKFDLIVMNPPFEKGEDMKQVRYLFETHLKPNGSLLAILGEGAFQGSSKLHRDFHEWRSEFTVACEKNPDKSFLESGTGVATRFLILESCVTTSYPGETIPQLPEPKDFDPPATRQHLEDRVAGRKTEPAPTVRPSWDVLRDQQPRRGRFQKEIGGSDAFDLFSIPQPEPPAQPVLAPVAQDEPDPPASPKPEKHIVIVEPVPPAPEGPILAKEDKETKKAEKAEIARAREAQIRQSLDRSSRFGTLRLAYLAPIRQKLLDCPGFPYHLGRYDSGGESETPEAFLEAVEADPTLLDLLANCAIRGIASRHPEMTPECWAIAYPATLKFLEFVATCDGVFTWTGAQNASA